MKALSSLTNKNLSNFSGFSSLSSGDAGSLGEDITHHFNSSASTEKVAIIDEVSLPVIAEKMQTAADSHPGASASSASPTMTSTTIYTPSVTSPASPISTTPTTSTTSTSILPSTHTSPPSLELLPLATRLKALYKAQDKLPKLVEDASVPEQKMDDYYVKLQIVMKDKESGQEKHPIVLKQMFEQVEKQDAVGKVLEKDLSLAVASSAIQIAIIRQNDIIKTEQAKQNLQVGQAGPSDHKPIDKAMTRFNEEIDKLLTKASEITKTELTPAEAMAVKDVILFINYIATHDDVLKVTNQGQGLDKAITDILCNHALLQTSQSQNQGSSQSGNRSSEDCIVCKADQFTYDNELLNHPELLQFAIQHLGSRAVVLSAKLSLELIAEAARDESGEGHDLLLAGLMSADYDADSL